MAAHVCATTENDLLQQAFAFRGVRKFEGELPADILPGYYLPPTVT